MRTKLFLLCPALFSLAILAPAVAHATPLPIGAYSLSLATPTSGIHSGSDEGTLSGTLIFDAASNITFANLVFDDTTTGTAFSFTNPGPTSIDPGHFLGATISNATDPATYYELSIALPSNSLGNFNLTCGTDCHTWMNLDEGGESVYVELNFGPLTPAASAVPEPSSLLLLGTGLFGALATMRRRPIFQP